MWFFLTLPPDGDPAAVETRLLAELQRVVDEGIDEAELTKARNILLADFWRDMATIDGKAAELGRFEVFHGDYEKLFVLPEALDAVTSDDLVRVAAAAFRTSNMTVGVLRSPETGDEE